MTIHIKGNNEKKDNIDFCISNDDFISSKYINLCYKLEDGYRSIDVLVEDLFRAVEVFNKIRIDNKE
jgi:hypothetical protein